MKELLKKFIESNIMKIEAEDWNYIFTQLLRIRILDSEYSEQSFVREFLEVLDKS